MNGVIMTDKVKVATVSLAGCFGCHMSLLDIDERIVQLADQVEFIRSPLTDIKRCTDCDIGLIEGGVCNSENVHTLREFRKHCRILVAVGACAINGGLPNYRNYVPLEECLGESYLDGIGVENPHVPNDPELPLLLDKVYPVHEVVKIDYFLPGCPPAADVFWKFLTDLLEGRDPALPYELIHYD
jgi:NAD-reducing hydrogenase small subunit